MPSAAAASTPYAAMSPNSSDALASYDQPYHPQGSPNSRSQSYRNAAGEDKDYDGSSTSEGYRTPGGLAAAAGGATNAAKGSGNFWSRRSSRARKLIIAGLVALLVIVAVAIAVPVALNSMNDDDSSSSASSGALAGEAQGSSSSRATAASSANPAQPSASAPASFAVVFGGDGSTVELEDGTTFVYRNPHGGFWNSVAFNDSARAQSWAPALNEDWNYDTDLIRGVNLGGWLTLEPFIVPGMFEPFNSNTDDGNGQNNAIDEWTLSIALGSNLTAAMTEHYETFITERDFAEIAGAGLNWIRMPIPYWIIEKWDDEPFLANVGWTYFLKALTWARKYGLRVNVDLHAVPGSQNGYNHSSKQGLINLLNGSMGLANAQRLLDIIRTVTQFVSQPEYRNVVPMFSVLNEPYSATIGIDTIRSFYLEVHNMMRDITGYGTGNGPFIGFHDAFPTQDGIADADFDVAAGGWLDFAPGMDRVALDTHPYLCFSAPNDDSLPYQAAKPCVYWGEKMNLTTARFGLSIAAEWSLAINDCGKWLNNVGNGQRYEGTYRVPGTGDRPFEGIGQCEQWTDYTQFDQARKDGLRMVYNGHVDAFRHFFFWTWKTGFSTDLGRIANPLWNYQLGLQEGWIPNDPREALGVCPSYVADAGMTMNNFPAPPLSAWMTGGAGAGTIQNTAQVASYTWPPAFFGNGPAASPSTGTPLAGMYTYTPTGSIVTMPTQTITSMPQGFTATPSLGNGWAQPTDTAGWHTEAAGCDYPDAWSGAAAPTAPARCATRAQRIKKRHVAPRHESKPTPAPAKAR